MQESWIWLVGMQDHERSAIARSADAEELKVRAISLEELVEGAEAPPVLVVVEAAARSDETIERFRTARKASASAPVVVIGRYIDIDHAVALSRAGVADVVSVPRAGLGARVIASRREPLSAAASSILVGETESMRNVRERIMLAAGHNSTVLLTGETGTGKGVAARLIHDLSPTSDKPLVHTDCAALSATVIESELFGHERGAFTNASHRRTGRFEAARDGTVFLDEIAELDLALQSKMLRILQDREFERVGGEQTLSMEARVIAATNRILTEEVKEGRFRPDLYFRLRVFEIEIPPLRDRLSDIPILVEHGLRELGERLQVVPPKPTPGFNAALREQSWPGNVRELYNVLERAIVSGLDGELQAEHAISEGSPWSITPSHANKVANPAEGQSELAAVLRGTGGNVSRAARRLGVSRTTLQYRIRKQGLEGLIPQD
jgi:two-component system response regulator HydG